MSALGIDDENERRRWEAERWSILRWMIEHDRPEGWIWGELPGHAQGEANGVGGSCPWKRMQELRALGLIEWLYRESPNGAMVKVRRRGPTSGLSGTQGACRVTEKGRQWFG